MNIDERHSALSSAFMYGQKMQYLLTSVLLTDGQPFVAEVGLYGVEELNGNGSLFEGAGMRSSSSILVQVLTTFCRYSLTPSLGQRHCIYSCH